ncbi:MAG: MBL fold metallo-hydrolase [Candidatus Nomurabacteria bacterium]|nr:MAG: MBL fold metallo-hydrolase [Candidatus Nomurabacteria bacterium]
MKRIRLILFVLCIFVAGYVVWSYRQVHFVRVTTLDIGQGDAILIQALQHFDVLTDAGADMTVVERLGERLPYFDRTIELLVLTHPDADHVTGFVEVLHRYHVQSVLLTGVEHYLPAYQEFLQLLVDQGVTILYAQPGQRYSLPGAELTVLAPKGDWRGKEPDDQNRYSVVTRLDVGAKSFILTGDADFDEEKEMLESGLPLHADVLKLGHHGSKTSSSDAWLDAVEPSIVIVSAGLDNQFGHPSPETLERVEQRGAQILSTIEEGDVCIEVRGEELWRC